MDSNKPHHRIKELDGLRGVAILAVMDCHYLSWFPAFGAPYGWLGVDLFFVLSGFLITSILLELRDKEHYFTIFYSRRALRIFPPYYLGIFVYLIIALALGRPGTWGTWLRYIFYYSSLILSPPKIVHGTPWGLPLVVQFGLGIMWSLSVEEIYYTIWAPIVRFTRKNGFVAVLLAMMIIAPTLRLLLYSTSTEYGTTFYCRMDALAYGSAVALLIRHRRISLHVWLQRDKFFDWRAIVIVPFSVVFWMIKGLFPNNRVAPTLALMLADVSFALVTYALIRRAGGNQLWVRFFRARWLRSIGMVSYSLYLFHYPLAIVSGELVAKLHLSRRVDTVSSTLLGIAMSFAVAYGLWYGMESRILRWKDRKVPSPAHP